MHRELSRGLRILFDNLTGQNIDWHMQYLEKTQWMKKKDLQRLQLKRLKRLLNYAYEKVPFYHSSFKREDLHPADFKTLDDIRRIPILKKSDVRYNLDQLIPTDYSLSGFEAFTTSGTSAMPLRFHRGISELSWARGAEHRAYGWGGYRLGDKIALIWGFEPQQTRSFEFKFYHHFTRQKILNVNFMSEKSMLSYARSLVRFKPDFVRGYSTSTNVFAGFLLRNRQLKIQPKAVFTSAATLLPHHRKTIEEAFSCKVYDVYGSREISGLAAQCGQHEGLHASDENVVLEIIEDGEQASSGEDGRIYLTNLHSYAMPFIRYDIGDIGKSFPDECPCGRKLSLLKPFGRTYEYLTLSDGSYTMLRDLQQVFADLPIVDFQIVQEECDELVVKIVARPGYDQTHSRFVANSIKIRGSLDQSKVRVELVDAIPKEKSGKTKHLVKKVTCE